MQMEGGLVHVYFEAAAVITALVLLGQVLELRARSRTNAAIQLLLGLAPKTARLVRDDGQEEDIPLEEVQPGDIAARASRRKNTGGRYGYRRREHMSTNPWSPASPSRWRKRPGIKLIGATVNGRAAS